MGSTADDRGFTADGGGFAGDDGAFSAAARLVSPAAAINHDAAVLAARHIALHAIIPSVDGDEFHCVWTARKNRVLAVIRCQPAVRDAFSIAVEPDDKEMIRRGHRFVLAGSKSIAVASAFLQLSRPMREAARWHEVGDIHLQHHAKTQAKTQDEIRQQRLDLIARGKLMPEEMEADDFAARASAKGRCWNSCAPC